MSLTAHWEPEREIWRIVSGERFTLDDAQSIMMNTEWGKATRFLWDLRALVQGPDSTRELRRAARTTDEERDRWQQGRVAVLVARDFDYGISRMFQAFAENARMSFQAFRDEAKALAWLDAG